jgi:hypothetical protein
MWHFLNEKSTKKPSSAKLRFHMLRKPISLKELNLDESPQRPLMDLEKLIGHALKLGADQLRDEDGGGKVDAKAYLLYHPIEHETELQLATRWLLLNNFEVFTPWLEGSWDCFCKTIEDGGSGVILVRNSITHSPY